jgi:hypothetical protein
MTAGRSIRVITDNQNVERAINLGRSRAMPCVLVMQKIFWLTVQRDIRISAAWVPREENAVADDISKWIDTTDVRLDPTVFASLSERWGPYDYDLFASANTRQVEKYFSWFHTPTSMGVNAFANTWTGTCWAFPPFSLLGPFWRHVASLEELVITVVVPVWPTAPWWDYVQPECGPQFAPCVRDYTILLPSHSLLQDWSSGEAKYLAPRSYSMVALSLVLRRDPALTPLVDVPPHWPCVGLRH